MSVAPEPPPDDHEVVAAVDGDGPAEEYVIADIAVDDAWLAVDAADAAPLTAWR